MIKNLFLATVAAVAISGCDGMRNLDNPDNLDNMPVNDERVEDTADLHVQPGSTTSTDAQTSPPAQP